jgi:hypothetical protein
MIYKKRSSFDTSQLLSNYNFYRSDHKSPLILQPIFSQAKVEEIEPPEILPIYFQRESKWVDSFAEVIGKAINEVFGDFLTKREESLSQLIEFTKEDTNPSLEKPSGHSIFSTLIYLFGIYRLRPDLTPDLAMSGDGGIYIEFQFADKFVSIQVNSESAEKDRLYIEEGEKFGLIKITEESFKQAFSQ